MNKHKFIYDNYEFENFEKLESIVNKYHEDYEKIYN